MSGHSDKQLPADPQHPTGYSETAGVSVDCDQPQQVVQVAQEVQAEGGCWGRLLAKLQPLKPLKTQHLPDQH